MGSRHLSEIELTEYADGELAVERVCSVEAHLRHCRSCSLSLVRIRDVTNAVARVAQASACPVPPAVRRRAAAVLGDSILTISCNQAGRMMHEHLDCRLSFLAVVPLEMHLHACRRCREEMAALSGATRLVRSLPGVESPPRVRQHVLATYLPTRRHFGVLRWRPAFAAAFAAAAVVATLLIRPTVGPMSRPVVGQMAEMPRGMVEQESPAPLNNLPLEATVAAPPVPSVQPEAVAPVGVRPAATEAVRNVTLASRVGGRERVQPTVFMPKGPAVVMTGTRGEAQRIALPAAFRALRMVAQKASSDWEVQRAMEVDGEPFLTLDSEAMAERRIAANVEGLRGDVPREPRGSASGKVAPGTQDNKGEQPINSTSPGREGASALNTGPLA